MLTSNRSSLLSRLSFSELRTFIDNEMPLRGRCDRLELRQAFQQLQVFLEQLIYQICYWLSLSLGQAL